MFGVAIAHQFQTWRNPLGQIPAGKETVKVRGWAIHMLASVAIEPSCVAHTLPGAPPFVLQALKELCDKCRFAMPDYFESEGPAGTTVAISLPQVSC